jgi:hypothetical protein
MSDIEKDLNVLNNTRVLHIRIPASLFEALRTSGKLDQIDIYCSILLLADLRREGFVK